MGCMAENGRVGEGVRIRVEDVWHLDPGGAVAERPPALVVHGLAHTHPPASHKLVLPSHNITEVPCP